MDRIKNNPVLPFKENNASVGSCGSGTTGTSENIVTVNIPNVGEKIDAPTNEPANWSAVYPLK